MCKLKSPLLIILIIMHNNSEVISDSVDATSKRYCYPLVIAHRGASGYVPEHTLGAYALSITMGSDFVEPDLVMTRDGHLISRHDNELSLTTNVGQKPEFTNRYRSQYVDGRLLTGWFTEDFTLKEIKTLRAVELTPATRPGNVRMNYAFEVPTFQEIIDLVKGMEISENRTIGLCPEIKHGTHFQHLNLSMEQPIVDMMYRNGYHGMNAHVFIQSFEVSNLKHLRTITELPLLQLISGNLNGQPYDQSELGSGLTYGDMAKAEGLLEISTYANAVGPEKGHIIPRAFDNSLGEPTTFVRDAHAAGLLIHPYTFRAENQYLPTEFHNNNDPAGYSMGDLEGEIDAFLKAGIDGLFVDHPDVALRMREKCFIPRENNSYRFVPTFISLLLTLFTVKILSL